MIHIHTCGCVACEYFKLHTLEFNQRPICEVIRRSLKEGFSFEEFARLLVICVVVQYRLNDAGDLVLYDPATDKVFEFVDFDHELEPSQKTGLQIGRKNNPTE